MVRVTAVKVSTASASPPRNSATATAHRNASRQDQESANGVRKSASASALVTSRISATTYTTNAITAGISPNSHHRPFLAAQATPFRKKPTPVQKSRSDRMPGRLAPERADRVPELVEQVAQQRQRETQHVAVVALDALDEPAAASFDAEPSGQVERLAGGDVGGDLLLGGAAEVDDGGRGLGGLLARGDVDHAVAGDEPPGAAAQDAPALGRFLGGAGLAVAAAVELQDGVAADDQAVFQLAGHLLGLGLGQDEAERGG